VRGLGKLIDVFERSERFTALRDPGAAITWARELTGVSKKLLTSGVVDAVVAKVNQRRITNSKDLRKLRAILPDPVARTHFLDEDGNLESAMLRLGPAERERQDGLYVDLDAAVEAMKRVPWTALEQLKGRPEILKKINDAETLLKSLRLALRFNPASHARSSASEVSDAEFGPHPDEII
jgi:ParB family transcriptional regulator, chromosome partitioning protein